MDPQYNVESFNAIMVKFKQRLLDMAKDQKEWQEHIHTMRGVMDEILQTAYERALPVDPFIHGVKDFIPQDGTDPNDAFWRINQLFQSWSQPAQYPINNNSNSTNRAEENGPPSSGSSYAVPVSPPFGIIINIYVPPENFWAGPGAQLAPNGLPFDPRSQLCMYDIGAIVNQAIEAANMFFPIVQLGGASYPPPPVNGLPSQYHQTNVVEAQQQY